MDKNTTLSPNEEMILLRLARKGPILITAVPDRNEKGIFGEVEPGRGVFKKLIAKGLAIETEEPVLEDGFQFTPTFELTKEGEKLARKIIHEQANPTRRSGPR